MGLSTNDVIYDIIKELKNTLMITSQDLKCLKTDMTEAVLYKCVQGLYFWMLEGHRGSAGAPRQRGGADAGASNNDATATPTCLRFSAGISRGYCT